MRNKVSVIVPVYNVEKYLEKCVESIVNQTYNNIEIILVDDGSSDRSGFICDELKKNNKSINVIHKKNGGLSSARNAGLEIASGKYVSFIDSDDFIEKEMYEVMVDAIEKSGKDIASCGRFVDIYGSHENIEFNNNSSYQVFSNQEAMCEVLHLSNIDVSACDKLYKIDLFKKIKYPEGKISEDAAVIFQLFNISNGVVHVGRAFYHYVFRQQSITKSKYGSKNYAIIENLENTENFINKYHTELLNDYKIYCCLSVLPQLITLYKDKKSKKLFYDHYLKYKEYFDLGYKETMNLESVSKRVRISMFCIRHNIIFIYLLIKKVYQLKYVLKR